MKNKYDGSKIGITLTHLQEQEMWEAIDKVRRENTFGVNNPITKDGKVIGKAIIISTVDENDKVDFKSIWNDSEKAKDL